MIQIAECIAHIEQYTVAARESFLRDTKTQDALRNPPMTAESGRKLSDGAKARRPEVEWRGLAGFRNVAVHDYLGLDMTQIWDIVERDIPGLKTAVHALLDEAT